MGKIQILQDNIINLIAAGEVVERPASIVKELLENSVDAGATSITVKVSQGGLASISIHDDGSGMDETDAVLAFKQHATSKISDIDDLENIHTLGFRGEALASITSVAHIELDTKSESTPPVKLLVHKDVIESQPTGRGTRGTTITVRDLFADVPARKKFLRTESTEFGYIQNTFLSVALVNLGVHFELYHNDKLIYRLPATTKFSDRVFSIWDAKVAEGLFVSETEQGDIKIRAYAGSPDIARGDRKLQYLFVNGRNVSDRLLQKAVTEAYQGFIHRDLQPVFFIKLDMPAALVDVNVHPRKQEVRFRDSGTIFNLVRHTVRGLLESSTKQELLNRIHTPATEIEPYAPRPAAYPNLGSSGQSYSAPRQVAGQSAFSMPRLQAPEARQDEPQELNEFLPFTPITNRYLQLFSTYIVYQEGEQVIFVDQHAAAEKILYEKLSQQLDLNRGKPLLVPEIVELDKAGKARIMELQPKLAGAGFTVEDFGGDSVQISAIPEIITRLDIANFLRELAAGTEESGDMPIRDHTKHYIVATMACHGAIRAGQPLTQPEMQQLINDLARCDSPYNCPHGRPVSWVLTRYELEKGFKRVI